MFFEFLEHLILLGVRELEKEVWLVRESHYQGLVFLKFLGLVWCDSRFASESPDVVCALLRFLRNSRVLMLFHVFESVILMNYVKLLI